MTPERWLRVREVFHQAIELSPSARPMFLRSACAGDDTLCRDVSALLDAHRTDSFLERPAAAHGSLPSLDPEPEAAVPARIGTYAVERLIARGGMGAVYLARRDNDFDKHVALKVLKRGMDTESIVRRFRNERQILAHFDHPGIARLLDGGTTADGLPYLVMEFIDGAPITRDCTARARGVRERLVLFRAVCAAVQYAHQHLVVHRDLKPSNILVTPDGVPKLLDFGIAKILVPDPATDGFELTATVMRVLTPEYASPEQTRGGPVGTASDTYALGVLLYELLTDRRPYRLADYTPEAIARAVCEQEPEPPSTAVDDPDRRRTLRGDLDAIVLKALEKDPAHRYRSVEALSDDVARYLQGLPIEARHVSSVTRGLKFVRRHRLGVAAATAVSLSLAGGLLGTTWQARVAQVERRRAELERGRAQQRFNDVRKLAGSFLFEFNDAIADLEGALPARQLVVRRGIEYLEVLWREAGNDPALRLELARAYLQLGRTLGNGYWAANAGEIRQALEMYERGVSLLDDRTEWPAALRAERADLQVGLFSLMSQERGLAGDVVGALQANREAQRAQQTYEQEYARSRADGSKEPASGMWSQLHLDETDLLTMAGDLSGALRAVRKMVDGQRTHGELSPLAMGTYFSRVGAIQHMLAASARSRLGDSVAERALVAAALESQRRGYKSRHRAWSAEPASQPLRALTGQCLLFMANAAFALEREADGQRWVEHGFTLTGTDQGTGSGPSDWGHHYRGRYFLRKGKARAALRDLDQARAGYERAVASQRENLGNHTKLAAALEDIADARRLAGERAAAEAGYRTSLQIRERAVAESPANAQNAAELVYAASRLGSYLVESGRPDDARAATRHALDLLYRQAERPGAAASRLTEYAWGLLTAHPRELRDAAAARAYARRAIDLPYGNHPESLAVLAVAHHLSGDDDAAVATALRAYALVPEMRAGRDDTELRRDIRRNLERHTLRPQPRPL